MQDVVGKFVVSVRLIAFALEFMNSCMLVLLLMLVDSQVLEVRAELADVGSLIQFKFLLPFAVDQLVLFSKHADSAPCASIGW